MGEELKAIREVRKAQIEVELAVAEKLERLGGMMAKLGQKEAMFLRAALHNIADEEAFEAGLK